MQNYIRPGRRPDAPLRVVDLHLGQGNEDSLQMLQPDHEWCGVAGLQWHSSLRVIAAVLLVEKVT
jgi:hypothetical protein